MRERAARVFRLTPLPGDATPESFGSAAGDYARHNHQCGAVQSRQPTRIHTVTVTRPSVDLARLGLPAESAAAEACTRTPPTHSRDPEKPLAVTTYLSFQARDFSTLFGDVCPGANQLPRQISTRAVRGSKLGLYIHQYDVHKKPRATGLRDPPEPPLRPGWRPWRRQSRPMQADNTRQSPRASIDTLSHIPSP